MERRGEAPHNSYPAMTELIKPTNQPTLPFPCAFPFLSLSALVGSDSLALSDPSAGSRQQAASTGTVLTLLLALGSSFGRLSPHALLCSAPLRSDFICPASLLGLDHPSIWLAWPCLALGGAGLGYLTPQPPRAPCCRAAASISSRERLPKPWP